MAWRFYNSQGQTLTAVASLEDIQNIDTTGAVDGAFLQYDADTSTWVDSAAMNADSATANRRSWFGV